MLKYHSSLRNRLDHAVLGRGGPGEVKALGALAFFLQDRPRGVVGLARAGVVFVDDQVVAAQPRSLEDAELRVQLAQADRAPAFALINGLDAERPETRDAALENLKRLTGQDLGQDREAWQAWWSENRDTFQP